jgi:hypothetical protein
VAARTIKHSGFANGLIERLRAIDPAGAYIRYAAYASAIAALAAAGGFVSALTATDAAHAKFGAIYAGILTAIALAAAQPGPDRRPVKQIAAIGGVVLACAAIGVVAAPLPIIAQPLFVVIVFVGFYVRRWPETWPSAGLLGVLAYLIHQILAPYIPQTAMGHAVPAVVAGVAIGYWFLPRAMFSSGFVISVRRLRAAIPQVLRVHLESPGEVRATVKRIDALLSQVNDARAQADRFDAPRSKQHLSLVNAAAVVARVWENTAESLHDTGQSAGDAASDTASAVTATVAAVADALDYPSPEAQGRALAALDALDRAVAEMIVNKAALARKAGDNVSFDFLNAELTLSHLLDAVSRLDEELTDWQEAEE